MSEWQPIETAPKEDGATILGAWQNHEKEWLYGVFIWRADHHNPALSGWAFMCFDRFNKITHWQPLSDPPVLLSELSPDELNDMIESDDPNMCEAVAKEIERREPSPPLTATLDGYDER